MHENAEEHDIFGHLNLIDIKLLERNLPAANSTDSDCQVWTVLIINFPYAGKLWNLYF